MSIIGLSMFMVGSMVGMAVTDRMPNRPRTRHIVTLAVAFAITCVGAFLIINSAVAA